VHIDEARNLFPTRHNTLVSFSHRAAAKIPLWTQDEIGEAFDQTPYMQHQTQSLYALSQNNQENSAEKESKQTSSHIAASMIQQSSK
jgi:hypothetical protein